jgi:hypothetical protein
MPGVPPQHERKDHVDEPSPMRIHEEDTMFHSPEYLRSEVETRRERLIRDVQAHPRREGGSRLQQLLHLPVRQHRAV